MTNDFYVAGIEGGGTKTECAIVSSGGECAGIGHGGSSNLNYVGLEAVCRSVETACREAVRAAGRSGVRALVTGCATLPAKAERMESVIERELGGEIRYYQEGEVALACVDSFDRVGVACVAGTGSTCFGFGTGGKRATHGGWGTPLGDEGGGWDIAVRGLRAAGRASENRGPATSLGAAAAEFFGCPIDGGFLVGVGQRLSTDSAQVAQFARMVSREAAQGDSVALGVLDDAAGELAQLTLSVVRELFSPESEFPVALHGGVFSEQRIADQVRELVLVEFPRAQIRRPMRSPGVGAALLALHDHLESRGIAHEADRFTTIDEDGVEG